MPEMLKMIDIELEEIENIQKEVDNGVISIDDIENRWVLLINYSKCIFYFENLSMSGLLNLFLPKSNYK